MLSVALKMLIGNRASFLGVLFGIFLATLLISQQSAIFLGLVSRSYRMITDIPAPNIWVIDPATESEMKNRGMPAGYLDVIRSIPNVEWAVPINAHDLPISSQTGVFHICQLYGIDDATLIGAPPVILEGNINDLRKDGAIVIDTYSANDSLASTTPDGTKIPAKLGDIFEINNRKAVVVGICKITQGFYPQPIIFTSQQQFKEFTRTPADKVSFFAVKTKPNANIESILKKINSFSNLNALTRDQIEWRMARSFLKTGILINFGLSVALGLIIGFSIAGLVFYMMTLQNIMYYALIKSLGGNQALISKMILIQVVTAGLIGFLLGTGATILWGFAIRETTLAFLFPWELLVFTGFTVLIICLFTAGLSIHKLFRTDPKMLMGN